MAGCFLFCSEEFLENHSVAITGGKIMEVLPSEDAAGKYSAEEVVDLPSHCIMPGLVNMHTVRSINRAVAAWLACGLLMLS